MPDEAKSDVEDVLLKPLLELRWLIQGKRREALDFEVMLPRGCTGQGQVADELRRQGWKVVRRVSLV